MNKLILASILLFTLIIPSALAISTDLKAEYSQGETMIIKLSGNILEPISKEQVIFRRNNVAVPFEYDIKKLNDTYYVWAITPQAKQNYTFEIRNLQTTVNGFSGRVNYTQNFSVSGNLTSYNIKPGFIITSQDFFLDAQLYEDEPRDIQIDFPSARTFTLQPGANKISFSVSNIQGTKLVKAKIGYYIFPIYLTKKDGSSGEYTSPVRVNPDYVGSLHLVSEHPIIYSFAVENRGIKDLKNIEVIYNEDIFEIEPEAEFALKQNETKYFNLTLNEDMRTDFAETIYLQSEKDNVSISIPFKISFTENVTQVIQNRTNGSSAVLTCGERSGNLCSGGNVCSGELIISSDGSCCLGACSEQKKGSKSWIGYLLFGLIIILLALIYLKYKKTKKLANPMDRKIREAERLR